MKWTKYMYCIYFRPFQHEFTLHMSVQYYHMKGSQDMHKLVVHMRLWISLRACVPGLHLFIHLTGWQTPLFTLTPCGTICPPGFDLKKWPFFGFATVKSTNKRVVTRVFRPFQHTNLRVLYCTVKRKKYIWQFWLTCVIQFATLIGVHWDFKPLHKHLGCCTPFRTPLRRC